MESRPSGCPSSVTDVRPLAGVTAGPIAKPSLLEVVAEFRDRIVLVALNKGQVAQPYSEDSGGCLKYPEAKLNQVLSGGVARRFATYRVQEVNAL